MSLDETPLEPPWLRATACAHQNGAANVNEFDTLQMVLVCWLLFRQNARPCLNCAAPVSTSLIENCTNLLFEGVRCKRLVQHLDVGTNWPLINDGLARVASHE